MGMEGGQDAKTNLTGARHCRHTIFAFELMQWARNCDPIVRNRTNNSQHVRLIISQLMNIKRSFQPHKCPSPHCGRPPRRPDSSPESADMRGLWADRLLPLLRSASPRMRRRKRGQKEKLPVNDPTETSVRKCSLLNTCKDRPLVLLLYYSSI
jgi:hypothetical protein